MVTIYNVKFASFSLTSTVLSTGIDNSFSRMRDFRSILD